MKYLKCVNQEHANVANVANGLMLWCMPDDLVTTGFIDKIVC